MNYADGTAAAEAWKLSGSEAPLAVVEQNDHGALEVVAPFADQPRLPRVSIDREVDLDLAAVGQFELEIQIDEPEAAGQVSLYFRSGSGWFASGAGVSSDGWHTLRFSKASFGFEDEPAGWHRIDGIRISVWRGGERNSKVRFGRLRGLSHDVAVVIPSAQDAADDGEVRAALEYAEQMTDMLAELGLGADAVDAASLAHGALGSRKVAVLAYNPRIQPPAVDALVDFIERGGKVFACYRLPGRLGEALGFRSGAYVPRQEPGYFAEIRLDAPEIAGLPEAVRQSSWNINAAEPAAPGARVIGTWYNEAGQSTGHPALLLSRHGAFLTHVMLSDDRPAKKQLLAALLGHFAPSLWEQMSQASLDRVFPIGHCDTPAALAQFVATAERSEARAKLAGAKRLLDKSHTAREAGEHPLSIETAHAGRQAMTEAYALAQPSPGAEGRAVWNHSGTGAYDGDWPRTARELAEAGFNMVIPNMLWAGVAHYPSDVLPRSRVLAEHGDQIAQCVEACHAEGIEVHVWKVNFNLSHAPKEFVEKLRAAGRTQMSPEGEPIDWLCPSHPENFELELASMLEVAQKYDVDGLHFDYIRYPGSRGCYCEGCRRRFAEQTGRTIENWPGDVTKGPHREAYLDWRCAQISRLVEAVHGEAKELKPALKISAAVFGSYPRCRESVGQDWVHWIEEGWLDFVCPMDYTQSNLEFSNLVKNQRQLIDGRIPLYPGIGAWRLSTDGVLGQVFTARRLGADGFTIFNLGSGENAFLPAIGAGAGRHAATPPHRR
jgi:uncharacterized lipoprotein YddW (UPF0748 family)